MLGEGGKVGLQDPRRKRREQEAFGPGFGARRKLKTCRALEIVAFIASRAEEEEGKKLITLGPEILHPAIELSG